MEQLVHNILQRKLEGEIKFEMNSNDLENFAEYIVEKVVDRISHKDEKLSNDDLIPRKEAMKILNVKTVLTMMRWEEKGILSPHRISSRIFYKKSEVIEAVERFERIEA